MELKSNALRDYSIERASLTQDEISKILEQGKQWNFAKTLKNKGTAFFSHTYIRQCGAHAAAAVHSCLDTSADQILALGVLHSRLRKDLWAARLKEFNHQNVMNDSIRGCHLPDSKYVDCEFSLDTFEFLFNEEVKRRGIKAPKLIKRFPYLVNRDPSSLNGIEELEQILRDSVVVATSDFYHRGKAYGHPPASLKTIDEEQIKNQVKQGFSLLSKGDYSSYHQYCLETSSDSCDVATVLHYLLGSFEANIHDHKFIDVSNLFEIETDSSWVSATVVECPLK